MRPAALHQAGGGGMMMPGDFGNPSGSFMMPPLAQTDPRGQVPPTNELSSSVAMRETGQRRRGSDAGSCRVPSTSRERMNDTEPRPSSCKNHALAESELEEIKVLTMTKMVETVTYAVGDGESTCQVLYMTNKQASRFSVDKMEQVRYALQIKEPKLVIRLMPSHFGKAYWRSNTRSATKGCSELTEEDEKRVEYQLLIFAKEVLLPLAMKNRALVIGTEMCSLTAAFASVCKPIEQMMGDECPFNMLLFTRAPTLDIASRRKGSIAFQFRNACQPWISQDIESCLPRLYGDDKASWPHEDIIPGVSQCIVFESLSDGKISEVIADRFQTDFITSLAGHLPVVALRTQGDVRLKYMAAAADHVNRGLPLLLVDSRNRSVKPTDLHEVRAELEDFRLKLHAQGKQDLHITSVLAFVKSMLNRKYDHIGDTEEDVVKECDRWLWDAINAKISKIKARKRSMHNRVARASQGHSISAGAVDSPKASRTSTPEAQAARLRPSMTCDRVQQSQELLEQQVEHDVLEAANEVLRYAGLEEEWEANIVRQRCEQAIEDIGSSSSWQEFQEKWGANWAAIRDCAFFRNEGLRHFDDKHDWCRGFSSKGGGYTLVIDPPGTEHNMGPGGLQDHREAVSLILDQVGGGLDATRQFDMKYKTLKAIMDQEDKWLAIYDTLKSKNVRTANLLDITDCRTQIDLMTRVDRLPAENTLESLVLLRCAWTLADVFTKHARYYKGVCKMAHAMFLLLTTAIVIVSSLSSLYPEAITEPTLETLLLVFSLLMSFVCGWTMFLDPAKKWTFLRGGQLELESEIWRFRARVGMYAGSHTSLSVLTRGESERQAEERFQQVLQSVRNRVLEGASLKETSFYSVTTSTDDIYVDVDTSQREGPVQPGTLERCWCFLFGDPAAQQQPGLTASHQKHGQYRGGPLGPRPGPGDDNFHSPVSPHAYIRWRLMREHRFYQDRIPEYARHRMLMQALLMCSLILATLITAVGFPLWTSIVAAVASGLSAWQEFGMVSKKLTRYSHTVESLGKLLVWWQSLKELDHSNVKHIEVLIKTTEDLISSEQASWRSNAERNLKQMQLQMQATDAEDAQKKAA